MIRQKLVLLFVVMLSLSLVAASGKKKKKKNFKRYYAIGEIGPWGFIPGKLGAAAGYSFSRKFGAEVAYNRVLAFSKKNHQNLTVEAKYFFAKSHYIDLGVGYAETEFESNLNYSSSDEYSLFSTEKFRYTVSQQTVGFTASIGQQIKHRSGLLFGVEWIGGYSPLKVIGTPTVKSTGDEISFEGEDTSPTDAELESKIEEAEQEMVSILYLLTLQIGYRF